VSMQDRYTVCAKHTISLEIVLDAPDGTPRSRGSSESLVCLEIVLTLTQDGCMVCVELLCDVSHVESLFFLFEDSVSVGARWVHGLR
jgi:hypothetical protein